MPKKVLKVKYGGKTKNLPIKFGSSGCGIQKIENCRRCGCKLPKNNKHHFYCNECWIEAQMAKGNFMPRMFKEIPKG